MAEKLALQQRLGEGGAVDGDERPVAPLARQVHRLGDQFLPRAALAVQVDGGIRLGAAGNQLQDLVHLFALGGDVVEAVALLQQPAQSFHLAVEPAVLQRLFELEEQLAGLEGLGEIAVGALLHRVDRALDGAVGGQNDHRHLRVHGVHLPHQRYAVLLGQLQIDDGEVEGLRFDGLDGLLLGQRRGHFVVRRLQAHARQLQQVPIVVHDQDLSVHRHGHTISAASSPRSRYRPAWIFPGSR